jgi:UDP-arabinose 4-epimerase
MEHLQAGGGSRAFNLATGRGTSVLEMIDAVAAAVGRSVPVVHAARRPGDPPALYARADLAEQVLGWKPRFLDIHAIAQTAADWFVKAAADTASATSRKALASQPIHQKIEV